VSSNPAQRLRLILGRFSDSALNGPLTGDAGLADLDRHLGYLYDRAYGEGRGMRRTPRGAGLGGSSLATPEWLAHLRDLFPKESLEVVERDALQRFGMTELLKDPAALEAVEPSEEILKLIVQFQSQIPPQAREQARRIVAHVVRDLHQKLALSVRPALTGAMDRSRRTRLKVAHNLDPWQTLRANLKNAHRAEGEESYTLGIDRLIFHSRKRRHADWRVIMLVDQSGSMLDSVVHSAIMGAVFASIPEVDFRLVAFDTNVVDLTEIAHDPVEVLFSVQLGGGTDIQKAVGYAAQQVSNPRRTIVVLLTDFFEGREPALLYTRVKDLVDSGVKMLGLATLGSDGEPEFDRHTAKALVALGMPVAAMTPLKLAEWVAQHVRGAGS